jgi:hypothetical protein
MVAARYRELGTTKSLGSDVWLNSHRFGLSVYIILSLVFFSVSLSRGYYPSRLEIRSFTTPSQIRSPSALNALPSDARLAKLVALQPPPIHFDPLTYLPVIKPHSHEITACLWAPESRLDWVSAWTTEWPGNLFSHLSSLDRLHVAYRSDLSPRGHSKAPNVDSFSALSRVGKISPPSDG